MASISSASAEAPRRPRGRPPSSSWAFFTTLVEPQKLPSAACRHCQQLVHYHKKWGQARTHLMKCAQFLRFVDALPPSDVPEWYLAEISRRQQSVAQSRSKAAAAIPIPVAIPFPAMQTPSLKTIQPAMMPISMAPIGENGSSTVTDVKKLEENVAMHLFTTTDVAQLVDAEKVQVPFLVQAFQTYSREFVLPSKDKLMTELLDRCFERVKSQMDGFFKSGMVPVSLSMDSNGDDVNYMANLASSGNFPMFLESVNRPSSGDAGADAEWTARDVTRVVEKLSSPVAGCVLPCSLAQSRQARGILEKQFPAMYFHGCMRDALMSLVHQIFVPNNGTSESNRKRSATLPFSQDLQQFALQCEDLAFFLPRRENFSYLRETAGSAGSMMHVTVRRRLSAEAAFVAVLRTEPFLDADSVLTQIFSPPSEENTVFGQLQTASIAHLQTQFARIVRSPQFADKLRKYLEVLRPIHALLSLLSDATNSTTLPLSEVYSSFSQLAQQYASSPLLHPDEKAGLQALVRRLQDKVLGQAHVLAYLLDPVLLGENLPADTKADAEQKLMASCRADGSPLSDADKEALYTQYMDFKKVAFHQKTNKAETLVFRTLKERKKSSLQFWFTDGAKWPALQAIACRIFVMPVCTFSYARVIVESNVEPLLLREKTDTLTSAKLAYVRVNARQLQLAEATGSVLAPATHHPPLENSAEDITASMVV
ncbi:putative transposase [Phytophthora cinnamomi]|uniref:putative transposase n=1 Tax=Phytophthora cinnamomi TaxID=4785 RepID=UPI0035599DBD|nr:putative transposase [Phytophthora cinnamomi]